MMPLFLEDDIVIVRKQEDFENNSIVVAIVNDSEATIKKAKKTDNGIILLPINQNYDPVVFTNDQIKNNEVIIVGIVKQLKRDF